MKIHPFRYGGEAKYFEGGSSVEACKFQEHKIATAICYDLRFPVRIDRRIEIEHKLGNGGCT